MEKTLTCQKCYGELKKTKKNDISIALQLVGVLVCALGITQLFFYPIGTIVGIILMIIACRMGFKQTKVWLCKECGYFFKRA